MNPFSIAFIVFGILIGCLLGTMLALIKGYNKQILELTKALIAKNLTDYTINTVVDKDKGEGTQEESDVIPAEHMTDEEFDRQIKEQLNG